VVRDPDSVLSAAALILPGVGHFGQMMRALDDLGLRDALVARINSGVPFLGICLGMQALYAGSEEAPDVAGLGILAGCITRFGAALRVPHMGWNTVETRRPSRLLPSTGESACYYFANSYHAPTGAETTGICDYGAPFAAVVERDNTFGVQFHPEKSGAAGLRLLGHFVELAPC